MANFSECSGTLKRNLATAITGDLGVNGNLCVEILSGQKQKTPASKQYKSGDIKGIRVDHEKHGSDSTNDLRVRIQAQKGSGTYATCVVHDDILPPPPNTIGILEKFLNDDIKFNRQCRNARKTYSEFWEKDVI